MRTTKLESRVISSASIRIGRKFLAFRTIRLTLRASPMPDATFLISQRRCSTRRMRRILMLEVCLYILDSADLRFDVPLLIS